MFGLQSVITMRLVWVSCAVLCHSPLCYARHDLGGIFVPYMGSRNSRNGLVIVLGALAYCLLHTIIWLICLLQYKYQLSRTCDCHLLPMANGCVV